MKQFTIFTDGCCLKNPGGAGGWCAIVVHPDKTEKVLTGGMASTTNNRMELIAALSGISWIRLDYSLPQIVIVTDSQYLCGSLTQKKTRKNLDLISALRREFYLNPNIRFEWVRGHNGHDYNERADAFALQAALKHEVRPNSTPVESSLVPAAE